CGPHAWNAVPVAWALGVRAALGLARARPAAAARVGAGLDPHGAGRAADRRVTLIDERVDQHAILFDVGVHLLLGPGGDRVDLDHGPPGVPFDHPGVAAGGRLLPPHTGDPGVVGVERPLQRHALAQIAAQVGVAPVQPGPELGVLLGHRPGGGDADEVHRVDRLHGVPGADRLGKVVTGVEEDDVQAGLDGSGEVDDDRVRHR